MEACHVGDRTQAGTQRHQIQNKSADADGLPFLVAQVGVSTALRTMSDGIGAGMGIGFTVSAQKTAKNTDHPSAEEAIHEPVFSRQHPHVIEDRLYDVSNLDGARR